jgi:hypothetical protein
VSLPLQSRKISLSRLKSLNERENKILIMAKVDSTTKRFWNKAIVSFSSIIQSELRM